MLMKKKLFAKALSLALAALMLFALCACGAAETPPRSRQPPLQPAIPHPKPPPRPKPPPNSALRTDN